ncbi:hypothetical protein CFC21_079592 [Triticum aestivum]|uniref:Uncharacterized protein n=4 Tax=Triticinae TaxID=1648030 RepID=A0A453LUE5_AEGTS|nr:uncharacterized protein LOC109783314 [Aegilops tauschii subsp. strangulata]XP_044399217.1 uncharacterized protein LOC123122906 [Triticum aestivum]KAF7074768.1 hypothetical protein CFC21_079592 [Triticum aestivum]
MAETLAGLRLAASAVPHPRSSRRPCAAAPAHQRLAQLRRGRLCARAAVTGAPEVDEDEAMSIDNLCSFFDLNVGKWNGIFYQFDAHGRVQQEISTRLSASTYGEGDLISLMQSLYIKQATSGITFADEEDPEPEWAEYKIKETNMFTVDKYQQIGFFPEQKAFALRYQTAGMLETVLRAGVLGEDDTGEESPRNLKIPSRKPSIVCENCIYSLDGNGRVRAFHIMDPNGVLDTLIVFHENQGSIVPLTHSSTDDPENPSNDRINALLGRWEGHSVTKRSGVYGATLDEADTVVLLEMDNNGQLVQDNISTKTGTSTTTTIHWTGVANSNLLQFDGGYEITLLPGGMYMGYPSDISKCIEQLDPFNLEFCWMESPGKRQRLVRTFDSAGLAVSSTYFLETKV